MFNVQLVLSAYNYSNGNAAQESIWLNTFILPVYLAVGLLVVQTSFACVSLARNYEASQRVGAGPPAVSFWEETTQRFEMLGATSITLRILRILVTLALTGFTAIALITSQSQRQPKLHAFDHGSIREDLLINSSVFTESGWIEVIYLVLYSYTSILALLDILPKRPWYSNAAVHLNSIMFSIASVYTYRDLFPYATYTLKPMDEAQGLLLWSRLGLSIFVGFFIPLVLPRIYTPVDPLNPSKHLNPEQTAPWWSYVTHSYLDPFIVKGSRTTLSYEDLPPLADYDASAYLMARGGLALGPYLNRKNRHIFWGLMNLFSSDYLLLALLTVIQCLVGFWSPLALNKLLGNWQDDQCAFIRPWFWALCLFVGPTMRSFSMSFYYFISSRISVRAEAIMTQVIFAHALRICMEETPSDSRPLTTSRPGNSSAEDKSGDAEDEGREDPLRDENCPSRTSENTTAETLNTSSVTTSTIVPTLTTSKPASDAASRNLVGKLNNLVTTDLGIVMGGIDFIYYAISAPLQFGISACFLYLILDWSAIVGMALTAISIPLPGYVTKLLSNIQKKKMAKTDARVQSVTEVLSVIRMIKLFGWEDKVNKQIADKRDEELTLIKKQKLWTLLNDNTNYFIPLITMVSSFACYTLVQKRPLTAAIVFTSIIVFEQLRGSIQSVLFWLPIIINARVSLSRINDFLHKTPLLDRFKTKNIDDESVTDTEPFNPPDSIGFRNATFTWSSDGPDKGLNASQRTYSLQIKGELFFKPQRLNLIIGPTGSGKTSMLMALLGEMHFKPSGENGGFNLPRDGGVAYAAQESWVQNETIKKNILFGQALDEVRYKKVLHQCGLEQDLSLFETGDETEVGEKGITLSGGQKARITLARAVYSNAQILLLDDILSALDVHTSRFIVDKCLQGDLMEGRTILLVTHNVAMVASLTSFVVSLATNGTVVSQGALDEALKKDDRLVHEMAESMKVIDNAADTADPTVAAKKDPEIGSKLVVEEEIALGHVGWQPLKLYLSHLGNTMFWIALLGGLMLTEVSGVVSTWFLGHWASQYDHQPVSGVPVAYYLSVYALLMLANGACYCIPVTFFIYASIKASRIVHRNLITSILGTTLRWLDTVPTARIISRCTQDIRAVDGPIPQYFSALLSISQTMLVTFGAVIIFVPAFLLPAMLVLVLCVISGQMYIHAQLPVKREMSNRRSPVVAHFNAAIAGLVSIRAYGAQAAFIAETLERVDKYTRAARTLYNMNRWIAIRSDMIGTTFTASLALYLFYKSSRTASETGFSLAMAVSFSAQILVWVRMLNEFEVQGNSLERIQGYINIDQEPKPTAQGVPPAYWPASGSLIVENLCARYSTDGPEVLHKISFQIRSGERIGIVGRTGSGKSSLTLSLLRCIPTDGTVLLDGLAINSINLNVLRSSITIIPQVPELLSGTLRENLDPFSEHSDATLNDALRSSGLFSLQEHSEEASNITLDSAISGGGKNLSVGQRQVLALARAILRRSKLVILDEATSAIDYATDSIIQNTLREVLKDATVITVAHRLQTIMDAHKIMVLDAGNMVEFDTPSKLLKKDEGYLKSLVDESGDRAALYEKAEKASRHRPA